MSRRHFRPLAIALCVASLCGCAGEPPQPPDRRHAIEALRASGYLPVRHEVTAGRATWELQEQLVDVSWLVPRDVPAVPLVVYLPGLGEDAGAGELWRRAWAEAGYAVLSLQPRRYGRAVYASPEAQAGAFRNLARSVYTDESLAARVLTVEAVLAEARRRGDNAEAGLAQVDWSHWALAGFDLGAQTAAALAGERSSERLSNLRPTAVVLLSPYVTEGAKAARFAGLDTPVLSIGGPHDEDPLGWLPSQRDALWHGLQVQGSYRLLALTADHLTLSGNLPSPGAGRRGDGPPAGGPRGGDPQMPLSFNDGGPPGGGEGPGGRPRDGGGRMGHGGGMDEPYDARQAANIQAVSLAFLDARLRDLPAAKAWLRDSAAGWLAGSALLEEKP